MFDLRRLLGAAALLVGAVAPLGVASGWSPAQAAGCGEQGVAVVVDYGALGGGVQQSCVSGGGKASSLFSTAGHQLARVQDQQGAVCNVDGKPTAPCPRMPPANQYWALFWTDGTSSHWAYATSGVDGLTVPAGGSLAFAWQSSMAERAPGIAPVATRAPVSAAAQPTKRSTKAATAKATRAATAPASTKAPASAATSPTARSSARTSARPSAGATPTDSATTATATPTDPAATSSDSAATSSDSTDATTDSGGGLPGWVAPALVVVVLAAGGGVAVARRRARG